MDLGGAAAHRPRHHNEGASQMGGGNGTPLRLLDGLVRVAWIHCQRARRALRCLLELHLAEGGRLHELQPLTRSSPLSYRRTCASPTAWAARWAGACDCWAAARAASTRPCTCRRAGAPACLLNSAQHAKAPSCQHLGWQRCRIGQQQLCASLPPRWRSLCCPPLTWLLTPAPAQPSLRSAPQVSGVSESARAAIEKAGGSVTTVYYNQLGGWHLQFIYAVLLCCSFCACNAVACRSLRPVSPARRPCPPARPPPQACVRC